MTKWTGRKVTRMRQLIYQRDQGICGICHTYAPLADGHVDHKLARSLGGTNHPTNLQWTHARCNLRKGVKSLGAGVLW
jgi:5-methylcytosine-specific restriction endonuclease McrA